MASGTSMVAFADGQMKMRWREPYVTEGLNKKMAGVLPRGVYRGFRLAANGANMILDVLADPVKGDHVALYETDTASTERYSVRLELTSGNFTIDLTAWPSQTVYVCLYAEYSILTTTAASIRVYTVAEYNAATEKDELIVLGTVDVPALGNPLTGLVNGNYRTLPFEQVATDAQSWVPLVKNGDFEDAPVSVVAGPYMIPHWFPNPFVGGADYVWKITDSDAQDGDRCLELYVQVTNATAVTLTGAYYMVSVEPGQRVKWRIAYKPLQTASTGDLSALVYFLVNEAGGGGTSIELTELTTTVTGSWIVAEGMFEVPAGYHYLHTVTIRKTAGGTMDFPSTGAALRIDSVQLFAEPIGETEQRYANLYARQLFMRRNPDTAGTRDPMLLAVSAGLELDRWDEDDTNALQPHLSIPGQLQLRRSQGAFAYDSAAVYMDVSDADLGGSGEIPLSYSVKLAPNNFAYREYDQNLVSSGRHYMTLNASWSQTLGDWYADTTSAPAMAAYFTHSGLFMQSEKDTVSSPINWDIDTLIQLFFWSPTSLPQISALYLGQEPFSGGLPVWAAEDFAYPDYLCLRNMCKFWFKVRSDGAGTGVATISVLSGFAVASTPAPSFSGGGIKVYVRGVGGFIDGFNMSGVANTLSTNRYGSVAVDASGSFLIVYAVDPTTGAVVDLENNADDLDVIVFGVTDNS